MPCFEAQGNVTLIDQQTYLYYIQLKPSEPSKGVWVPVGRETPSASSGRISAPVERGLSRRPADRVGRLHLRQRRHRQDRHLLHGRAAAGEDRRLHRLQEARYVPARRTPRASQTPRSGSTPSSTMRPAAGRRRAARDDAREGLSVRRRSRTRSSRCRGAQAGAPDVQRR